MASWPAWIVFIFACLCYSNTLSGKFLFDDVVAIQNNPDVDPERDWLKIFANDFWGRPILDKYSHKSYRPITTLSFRANAFVSSWTCGRWKDFKDKCSAATWSFHLLNVLLHALNSVLLRCLLLQTLGQEEKDATFATALLFAAHPIHTEAVANIVGRSELLAGLFYLSAVLCYLQANKRMRTSLGLLSLALLFSVASLLSKEQGVTVLSLFLLLEFLPSLNSKGWGSSRSRMLRATIVSVFTVCVIFLRLRLNVTTPWFPPEENPASLETSAQVKFLTYSYLASFNCFLLLLPLRLNHDYSHASIPLVRDVEDPRNLFSALFYAGMVGFFLFACWQSVRDKRPGWILAWFISVSTFLPCSNLFFPVGFVVAERVLYLPSIGYCLMLAMTLFQRAPTLSSDEEKLQQQGKGRKLYASYFFFLLLLLLYFLRTWWRNQDWQDAISLWSAGVRVMPENPKHLYGLGFALAQAEQHQHAVKALKAAVRIRPDYAEAYYSLGASFYQWSEQEEGKEKKQHLLLAERSFKIVLRLNPNHVAASYNLGTTLHRMGKFSLSVDSLLLAASLDPSHEDAYFNMGASLWQMGRMMDASSAYRQTLQLNPVKADAYYSDGLCLGAMGHPEQAQQRFSAALKLDPQHVDALFNLGISHAQMRRYGEALSLFQKTMQLNPQHPSAEKNAQTCQKLLQ